MTQSKSVRSLPLMALLALMGAAPPAATPIRLHPDNPHYFEFRGQPTVLVTSGEHYGAVMNLDFDQVPYLNRLQAEGLNLTRTFSGQYCEPWGAPWNTLNPPSNRYVTPWARSGTAGYADGGNKFDLNTWDPAYFDRLKSFVSAAGSRGIVVELVLFCVMYDDNQWNLSPMKASNNVNGIGNIAWNQPYDLSNAAITTVEDNLVRKIVSELNGYDNVYYELCNEPYFGNATQAWHQHMADVIVNQEASLPNKHLIAHNIANGSGRANLINAVSVLNYHYANPPDAIGQNDDYNRAVAFDETGFRGSDDAPYRTEAWQFLLAGGAVYSNLDWGYTVDAEGGNSTAWDHNLGGGGPNIQHQLGILKSFIHGFDFVHMAPDNGVVSGASAYALVEAGKQYAIHVTGGSQANITVTLPAGTYQAQWVNTKTGAVDGSSTFTHGGGGKGLSSPPYSEDIALRITLTAAAPAVKILPLGDSLTLGAHAAGDDGTGGYRNGLWNLLTTNGFNVDFVGSVNGPAAGGVDPNHEGHGGWRIDDLTGQVDGWLSSSQPDVILLLAGANDIIQDYTVDTARDRMNTLLDHLFADRPSAKVLLSTLPWVPQPNFYNYDLGKLQDFNSRLPAIVSARQAAGKNITLVDMYAQSGLTAADFNSDGVHPTDPGYAKMASVWFGALQTLLSATPPPPPPPPGSGTFYRAINLNGPALTIDGHAWEGSNAPNYAYTGSAFENQGVALSPATDANRATMIRSSIWNSQGSNVTMSGVPAGTYQVFLYVWEDNFSVTYSVSLEGQTVQSNYSSGAGGHWDRLGPWNAHITNGTIDITCTAGDANLSGLEVWQVSLDAPTGGGGGGGGGAMGPVLREYWTGVGGTAVSDLTQLPDFPAAPSGSSWEAAFEAPTDWADDYGTRMRAYVTAPADGAYTFWIAGDDNCELWLSTDEWPAHKVKIAWVPGWTNSREWTKYPEQQSAPIVLAAGQVCYIEALQKEAGGGDNLAAGWSIPGGGVEQPIPGVRLSAVDPALGPDAGPPAGVPAGGGAGGVAASSSGGGGWTGGGGGGSCGCTGLELILLLLLRRRSRP